MGCTGRVSQTEKISCLKLRNFYLEQADGVWSFTEEELANFNKFVQIDVFMNLSNLTLTNKKRSSNSKKQHVYDKQYALSMLDYFQKNSR